MAKLSKTDKELAANPAGVTSSSIGEITPTWRSTFVSPYGTKYTKQTPYGVEENIPKDVDPDEMYDEGFALIETEFDYGSPSSAAGVRKIRVGDELPEGSVTAITSGGIKVIPDEGDEYVIPLGRRKGYTPAAPKKPDPYIFEDIFAEARRTHGPKAARATEREQEALMAEMERIQKAKASQRLIPTPDISANNPKVQEAVKDNADVMDENTDIYREHAPDSIDPDNEDAVAAYAQDAAALDYEKHYKNESSKVMRGVTRDGIHGYVQVFGDGAVFFVSEDENTVMRQHSIN